MRDAVSPEMIRKLLGLSLWTAVMLVLCACGRPEISKTSSRPAAQVTGEASPAPRIDSVLANYAGGQITDQELLAQEALEARLDRDAQVSNAIESAKRQILAQAYIERTVISASQPSPEQISRFYEDNPALFKSRRIYRVRLPQCAEALRRIAGGGCRGKKPCRSRAVARFPEAFFRSRSIRQARRTDPDERPASSFRDARRTDDRFSDAPRRFGGTARADRGSAVEREAGRTPDRAISAQQQTARTRPGRSHQAA